MSESTIKSSETAVLFLCKKQGDRKAFPIPLFPVHPYRLPSELALVVLFVLGVLLVLVLLAVLLLVGSGRILAAVLLAHMVSPLF